MPGRGGGGGGVNKKFFGKFLKNPLLISVCILRDLSQQKNPGALCLGSSPNFIWSHGFYFILFIYLFFTRNGKESEEIKRKLFVKEVPVFVHSPEVWEHPRPRLPLPRENALVQEPPLQQNPPTPLRLLYLIIQ